MDFLAARVILEAVNQPKQGQLRALLGNFQGSGNEQTIGFGNQAHFSKRRDLKVAVTNLLQR